MTHKETNVLVIDDDPTTRDLLKLELLQEGFRAITGASLKDLRERLKERTFDIILLDLFLENESGLEAIHDLIRDYPFTKTIVMSAHGTVELAVDAMERGATTFLAKSKAPGELVKSLKERLERTEAVIVPPGDNFGLIGRSAALKAVLAKIDQLKDVDSTVLITGESGTGKELVARALHVASKRRSQRFEAVNCGAIPESLLEAELFGHRKGAFTDAKEDRKGLFEVCDKGTLLLDEMGELSPALQVKLLRVLQEREVMPLGTSQAIAIQTRVIVATNRNLSEEVKKGTFRSDLYYRLNVLNIHLPPLRERREDIPLLVNYFLRKFCLRFSKELASPSRDLEARLCAYSWNGNIRELQNAVERGVILSNDGKLHFEDMVVPELSLEESRDSEIWGGSLTEAKRRFEKAYLERLLSATSGNVTEAARVAGRYKADLYRLLSKYELESEDYRGKK